MSERAVQCHRYSNVNCLVPVVSGRRSEYGRQEYTLPVSVTMFNLSEMFSRDFSSGRGWDSAVDSVERKSCTMFGLFDIQVLYWWCFVRVCRARVACEGRAGGVVGHVGLTFFLFLFRSMRFVGFRAASDLAGGFAGQ